MSGSIEDLGSKIFGTLLAWGLVIYGVCWVIKWILAKIVENASAIIMGVAGIAILCVVVALLKSMMRGARDSKAFLALVEPRLKSLENELQLQTKQFENSKWESRVAQMEKTLADADA